MKSPSDGTIKNWISVVKAVRERRQKKALDAIKLLGQEIHTTAPDGTDKPDTAPNHVMAAVRSFIPSVYFADPLFRAIPQVPDVEDRARAVEAGLDFYWRMMRAKKTLRRSILNTFVYGYAAVHVGYASLPPEEETIEKAEKENERLFRGDRVKAASGEHHAVEIAVHQKLRDAEAMNAAPRPERLMSALDAHIAEHIAFLEEKDYPAQPGGMHNEGWPFIDDVTANLYWEPHVMNPQDSAFMILQTKRRLSDIKADPFYINTSALRGEPPDDYTRELARRYGADDGVLADLGVVTLFHIYHGPSRTVTTIADQDGGLTLAPAHEGPWAADIESYPFRMLSFLDAPDAPHGPPLLDFMRYPQLMINRLYKQIAQHTDGSGSMYAVQMSGFDEPEEQVVAKFNSSGHRVAFKVNDIQNLPIRHIERDNLDPALAGAVSMMENALAINAAPADRRSIQTADSATASSLIGSEINTLLQDNINLFEDFQEELGGLLLSFLAAAGPDRKTVLAATPNGQEWIEFSADDFAAPWQLRVKMTTATSERDKQQLLNLYAVIKDDISAKQKMYLQQEMVRVHGYDANAMFTGPDPVEDKLIQMEHDTLLQGKPVPVGEGENHKRHIELHSQMAMSLQRKMADVGQQIQQGVNPAIAQTVMQQETAPLQAALAAFQSHIQEHGQQAQSGQPKTRASNAVPFRTGNSGTVHSLISAQTGAGF